MLRTVTGGERYGGNMSIFGTEYQYGQGMLASAIKVGEKSQGGEGGRGHWGGSEEEPLERNMGKFKFGGR